MLERQSLWLWALFIMHDFLCSRHIFLSWHFQSVIITRIWSQFWTKAFESSRPWLIYAQTVDGSQAHWRACVSCKWSCRYSLERLLLLSRSEECFYLIHFSLWLQGMWSDQDSSLWMISCMNDDLLGSLTARGIHTLHQLLELPRETLKSITGNFPASKLSQVPILSQIGHICFFFMDLSDSSIYSPVLIRISSDSRVYKWMWDSKGRILTGLRRLKSD